MLRTFFLMLRTFFLMLRTFFLMLRTFFHVKEFFFMLMILIISCSKEKMEIIDPTADDGEIADMIFDTPPPSVPCDAEPSSTTMLFSFDRHENVYLELFNMTYTSCLVDMTPGNGSSLLSAMRSAELIATHLS